MSCASCGTESELFRRFCSQCGARVRSGCVRCGFLNGLTDRHCGGCSDALPAPQAERESPRAAQPRPTRSGHGTRELLSSSDLEELLHQPVAPIIAPLSSEVSQSELDQLFGAGK